MERKEAGAILAIILTVLLLRLRLCANTASGEKGGGVWSNEDAHWPAAEDETRSFRAEEDYIRYFNEQEIIPGVTVKYVWRDSALQLDRWASAYQAFKERGAPILNSNDSVGIVAFHKTCERDKIPLFCPNSLQELVYPPLVLFPFLNLGRVICCSG